MAEVRAVRIVQIIGAYLVVVNVTATNNDFNYLFLQLVNFEIIFILRIYLIDNNHNFCVLYGHSYDNHSSQT